MRAMTPRHNRLTHFQSALAAAIFIPELPESQESICNKPIEIAELVRCSVIFWRCSDDSRFTLQ
jgi:hypothetical protein